ncbi:HupE/UreJ family protein [Robertkochia solimangrovi]|uniref:HupE/UreJ family protein n=1 Tax=Robertkochia solimangrovi TaxID=2213046 RepID=UPI00117F8282|nr:HupE/UreJ family protein [Robertkochia solimangrovi]TRZ45082.1 HupE/UreJ family protein [Robertkochia solimangrovi]
MKLFKHIIIVCIFLISGNVVAHEIRPAYLQIIQTDHENYEVLWRVPAMGTMILQIYPEFDPSFTLTETGIPKPVYASVINRFTLSGPNELAGTYLNIVNLNKTMVDVLVTITYLNGEESTLMLQPDSPSGLLPGKTGKGQVIQTYTRLGIEHIWLGIDHLLFVLALIIITKGFRKIVKTITAFTLAHSITLSLAVLGYADLPAPPVEAMIALSIVFLASEILKIDQGKPTLTSEKPWLVAFSFGLLHGFGFAGALSDIGLPSTEIPLALAFFNIGVEIGQILFVILIIGILRLISLKKEWPTFARKIPAYAIGTVAAFWTIERVIGFF